MTNTQRHAARTLFAALRASDTALLAAPAPADESAACLAAGAVAAPLAPPRAGNCAVCNWAPLDFADGLAVAALLLAKYAAGTAPLCRGPAAGPLLSDGKCSALDDAAILGAGAGLRRAAAAAAEMYTGGAAAGGGIRGFAAAPAPARRVACSAGNESVRGADTSWDDGAAASVSDPDPRAGWRSGGSGVVGRRDGSDALCGS